MISPDWLKPKTMIKVVSHEEEETDCECGKRTDTPKEEEWGQIDNNIHHKPIPTNCSSIVIVGNNNNW